MTPARAPAPSLQLPSILGSIRPRARWTEARLMLIAAVALIVGSISLSLGTGGGIAPYDARGLTVYVATLGFAHLAQVLAGRRSDEILLPVTGLLGGSRCCSWSGCRRTS